jgi:hypothetical protein
MLTRVMRRSVPTTWPAAPAGALILLLGTQANRLTTWGESGETILPVEVVHPSPQRQRPTSLPAVMQTGAGEQRIRTLFGTKKSQVQILSPRPRSGPVHSRVDGACLMPRVTS